VNEHGDVTQLWGQSGTCKASYEYDAFGNEWKPEKGDENPFRYCGEYLDLETKTYYLRARNYRPVTGRFTSEDTARAGLNWYAYCENNPVMFADPTGLDAILVDKTIDYFVGIEHMSIFIQDGVGDWYFFFQGTDVKYTRIEDPSIFESMDKMNAYLYENDLYAKGNRPYRESVYIKGDFTAAHESAGEILDDYQNALRNGQKNPSNYDFFGNNCGQVSMGLFYQGILPDGTNVGDYLNSIGYSLTSMVPNINLGNMQTAFYNKALNLDGFNAAIQHEQSKYEGKGLLMQLIYLGVESNINKIR